MDVVLSIPPEVWLISLKLLEPYELSQFVLVSSTFLAFGRPLLYQSVHLRHSRNAAKFTVDLLKRDHILCRNVQNLELTTHNNGLISIPWFDIELFVSMPRLRSLTVNDFPYRTPDIQQLFLDTISKSCRALKAFTYNRVSDVISTTDWTVLPHLERLTWDDCSWSFRPQVPSMLHKSRSSITHISLPASGAVNHKVFEDFCKSRFPSLISLELGPLVDIDPDFIPERITPFLVTHPQIEHLTLRFTLDDEWSIDICDHSLTVDMLPNLISLHARADVVSILAFKEVKFLRNISKLYVGHGISEDANLNVDDMFLTLEDYGGLPALTELQFELGEWTQEHEVAAKDWMESFVKTCPNLRRLVATLPMMTETDNLAPTFASFGKLTHLDLTQDELDLDYYVATGGGELIISGCRHLEEVILRSSGTVFRRVLSRDSEFIRIKQGLHE